jgi:hypothetical protein
MFSSFFANSQKINCACPAIKETIPLSERGYHTNNKYPKVPPLMNDGRSITAAWQPNATANSKIIADNNIRSNWQYRRYLTKNAKDIMVDNYILQSNDAGYNSRPIDLPNIQSNQVEYATTTPYLFNSTLDSTMPFGTVSSDLKETYLTREQLYARKVSPVITQDQLIKTQVQPINKKQVQPGNK